MLNYADFEVFYERIIQHNIKTVTLIGGEPTIHPNFLQIIKQLKDQQVFLNTNGLMFSDLDFLQDCINIKKNSNQQLYESSGLESISISLKGYDEESFFNTTQTHDFNRLRRAINNLNTYAVPVAYSYTYAKNMTLPQREKFVSFLNRHQIDTIVLNDVRPYYHADNFISHPNFVDGLELLTHYLEDANITVYLRLNQPLCMYNQSLINHVVQNQQLISKCAVKSSTGYFFSASLELIPCNELSTIILGKFLSDFNTFVELERLWNTQYIRNFYQKLSGYPDIKCKQCSFWRICGGSCILYWLK